MWRTNSTTNFSNLVVVWVSWVVPRLHWYTIISLHWYTTRSDLVWDRVIGVVVWYTSTHRLGQEISYHKNKKRRQPGTIRFKSLRPHVLMMHICQSLIAKYLAYGEGKYCDEYCMLNTGQDQLEIRVCDVPNPNWSNVDSLVWDQIMGVVVVSNIGSDFVYPFLTLASAMV